MFESNGADDDDGGIPKVVDAKVEDTTYSSITISWSKPQISDNADNGPIKGYRVTCAPSPEKNPTNEDQGEPVEHNGESEKDETSGGSKQEVKLFGADKTRAKISELTEEAAYVLEVFTICGGGESEGTVLKAIASK